MDVIERKVCIVCTAEFENTIYEYQVFVIDLRWFSDDNDEYEWPSMSPTVRFDREQFCLPAFCVVGSTLYMVVGYNTGDDSENPSEDKWIYTYQLSPDISNLKLDKDMLSVGPAMNGVKFSPKAIVAPNGMILVFSRVIHYPWPNECDFELYDPEHKKWHTLPNLCPSMGHIKALTSFWIETFTFMDENVFFVKTKVGLFTLDIMAPNKEWKTNRFCCSNSIPIPQHIGTSLVLIKKDICMIPYKSFAIHECGEPDENEFTLFYKFPELSKFKGKYSDVSGGVVLLENHGVEESKVLNVCLLHSGINKETKGSEIMLQVYSCNLEECKKELHKHRLKKVDTDRDMDRFDLPATRKIKTYKIRVKPDPVASSAFGFCSFASIPVSPIETEMTRTAKRRRIE